MITFLTIVMIIINIILILMICFRLYTGKATDFFKIKFQKGLFKRIKKMKVLNKFNDNCEVIDNANENKVIDTIDSAINYLNMLDKMEKRYPELSKILDKNKSCVSKLKKAIDDNIHNKDLSDD